MKVRRDICAYCGAKSPVTVDHIPPRCVFPRPRASDLITVPCCFRCNQSAGRSDDRFKAFLSLTVGVDTPETQALWEQSALPGIRHNRAFHQELLRESRRIQVVPPGATEPKLLLGVPFDRAIHDTTIERLIRGLYFHHFGEALGDHVSVDAHLYPGINAEMLEATQECEQVSVADDQFVYRYGRALDGPLHSIWLFQFHKAYWAGGGTMPVGFVDIAQDGR